ncbi:phospholipase D family protein [Massilia sp. R2A-15]|uniref:phospholipase D family nuclease n=1 Tax=Massilia sp. R2A-15 TaxID=3064278 RepID=UPI0035A6AD3D
MKNPGVKVQGQGVIETAFSPNGGSEELVVKVIDSSEKRLRLAAYSFTSPAIVSALIAAKRRGVDVQVVVDEKGNKGKASIAALNLLVNSNIPARTISAYPIHHDKFIVCDDRTVQNGSFNYSRAAAKSNSENVLVVWNNSPLANSFLSHWQSRWDKGTDVRSTY